MSTISKVRVPAYRLHKPTGQAVVTLNGRDIYLGRWNTNQSRREYDRAIGEWIARDRSLSTEGQGSRTIVELAAAYWKFAKGYYQKNGRQTATRYGIRAALRPLLDSYGHMMADVFGPLALKALQKKMIAAGQSRSYINDNIDRIRRMFKWAVSEQLVPPAVYQALQTVPGLRKGRTAARETPPVRPIGDDVVQQTLLHLPLAIADMVRLQRLTGCRPQEICLLRPGDLNTSGAVWSYVPESHKTEHHERERTIFIGPQAQLILRPYLDREEDSYCFAPAESEQGRNAVRRRSRESPMTPSHAKRQPARNPNRPPGNRYTTDSYRRAITRACARAFPIPEKLCPSGKRGISRTPRVGAGQSS
jgi:integrase